MHSAPCIQHTTAACKPLPQPGALKPTEVLLRQRVERRLGLGHQRLRRRQLPLAPRLQLRHLLGNGGAGVRLHLRCGVLHVHLLLLHAHLRQGPGRKHKGQHEQRECCTAGAALRTAHCMPLLLCPPCPLSSRCMPHQAHLLSKLVGCQDLLLHLHRHHAGLLNQHVHIALRLAQLGQPRLQPLDAGLHALLLGGLQEGCGT